MVEARCIGRGFDKTGADLSTFQPKENPVFPLDGPAIGGPITQRNGWPRGRMVAYLSLNQRDATFGRQPSTCLSGRYDWPAGLFPQCISTSSALASLRTGGSNPFCDSVVDRRKKIAGFNAL